MPPGKRVVFTDECNQAAERLGGYARIDCSLDAFWDGLYRNPYGFPKYESDWFSVRYIITKPIYDVPPLIWYISVSADEVLLLYVEEYEKY